MKPPYKAPTPPPPPAVPTTGRPRDQIKQARQAGQVPPEPQVDPPSPPAERKLPPGVTFTQGNGASLVIGDPNEIHFEHLVCAIGHIQHVRKTSAFKEQGFQTFREWTVSKFGTNLGCMIDDIL